MKQDLHLANYEFDHLPETKPFRQQPPAMRVGAPGKQGYLRMVFECDKKGKSILRQLERKAPLIVQQELYFDEEITDMPCVYILSSGGPNVDGDRFYQEITLKNNTQAHISTGAATKIAEMKYNYSGLKQCFNLAENAYLEYLPEPIIPCRHSRFASQTDIIIHPSASFLYSEIYTCGRKYYKNGESFHYDLLSVCTNVRNTDNTPLFREKFIITPSSFPIRNIGLMHRYDVFANVILLCPPENASIIYQQIEPHIDHDNNIATGITYLPNNAGLMFKVLTTDVSTAKRYVRTFSSRARLAIKGKPLPQEFPWR